MGREEEEGESARKASFPTQAGDSQKYGAARIFAVMVGSSRSGHTLWLCSSPTPASGLLLHTITDRDLASTGLVEVCGYIKLQLGLFSAASRRRKLRQTSRRQEALPSIVWSSWLEKIDTPL